MALFDSNWLRSVYHKPEGALPVDAFRSDWSDAEALRRQADDMECLAEVVCDREAARMLKRQASELRRHARHM